MALARERMISSPSAKYQVDRVIAVGGMKSVLRASDCETGRDVAMAVMNDPANGDREAFLHEALLTARLEHPNIVPVHEIGTGLSGEPYFTMKLLNGVDLSRVLDKLFAKDRLYLQAFPLSRLLEIFLKICDAVAFAHSKGFAHLDLKPENVQIGEFGEVIVLDWGLAKKLDDEAVTRPIVRESVLRQGGGSSKANYTADGIVKGTPAYMAPEQAAGRNSVKDERTDVYALGAILYSILTFRPPVSGATVDEQLANVIRSRIIPARKCAPPGRPLPPSLECVAYKALDRSPSLRYQSVNELKAEIEAYLAGFATKAEDAGLLTQLWLLLRRKRTEAALGAAAATTIAIILLVMFAHLYTERARAERALRALKMAEAKNAGLVERMSSESKREWRLLFEEGFRDKYLFERWSVNLPKAVSREDDGIEASSPSMQSPVRLFLRQRHGLDSSRLLFEAAFQPGDLSGELDVVLQGSSAGDGYCFKLGGPKNPKTCVSRGETGQSLAEVPFSLPAGRLCQVMAEVVRESDGAKLKLEVDGREILSTVDSSPAPLNPADARPGFIVSAATVKLGDFKFYALDAPLKAELLDIASRHLNKGNFSTAADLFGELAETSAEPQKRELAVEGLHLARLLQECKSRLPEWRAGLTRAWPSASVSLSIDKDGFRVEVAGPSVSDLSALRGLPATSLKVSSKALESLSSIEGLSLTSLDLGGCSVKDLSPLASMPLKSLDCDSNPIGSVDALAKLSKLKSLSVNGCGLKSLEGLRGLELSSLEASGNAISSFEPVASMPLERLDCSSNPVKSLKLDSPLLKSLDAGFCDLQAVPDLNPSKLETLDLQGNSISSLEPLRACSQLKSLRLDANKVSELAPLRACSSLELLSLSWNRVSSLAPLSSLKLVQLRCDGNAVASLEPLRSMDGLKALSVQRNSIRDLSPLAGLFSLLDLDVSANPVRDLSPLDSLSLDSLLCGDCPVESFGKALAFPPRRRLIIDRANLSAEAVSKLAASLGAGQRAKELELSLNALAAFKRGDAKALKELSLNVDGRLYILVPTMASCDEAKLAAVSVGASLPEPGSSERAELLFKRFGSPFWLADGSRVSLDGKFASMAASPKKLLPLVLEWR